MRQRCVLCVVNSTPLSQFMVSARSIIVLNVWSPTLVTIGLFVGHMSSDMHGRWIQLFRLVQCALYVGKVCGSLWYLGGFSSGG